MRETGLKTVWSKRNSSFYFIFDQSNREKVRSYVCSRHRNKCTRRRKKKFFEKTKISILDKATAKMFNIRTSWEQLQQHAYTSRPVASSHDGFLWSSANTFPYPSVWKSTSFERKCRVLNADGEPISFQMSFLNRNTSRRRKTNKQYLTYRYHLHGICLEI